MKRSLFLLLVAVGLIGTGSFHLVPVTHAANKPNVNVRHFLPGNPDYFQTIGDLTSGFSHAEEDDKTISGEDLI